LGAGFEGQEIGEGDAEQACAADAEEFSSGDSVTGCAGLAGN
jgi:hypothetical protein